MINDRKHLTEHGLSTLKTLVHDMGAEKNKLSQYSVALFHLLNHAFFKALLFLSAGAVIHAMADEQV